MGRFGGNQAGAASRASEERKQFRRSRRLQSDAEPVRRRRR